jgi:hypothetical protein
MTKRYQKDNQNLYIRQHNDQKITKGNQNWYTDSDCSFGIFWSLCCLIHRFWFPLWYLLVIVLSDIQILITPLVSFGHCVVWYTDSDNDQNIPKGQSETVYQTTQWPKDTKGAIIICISDNTMTKRYQRVIRIRISDNTMTKKSVLHVSNSKENGQTDQPSWSSRW